MIVVIDNYDSFAHNLARYLRQLGQQTFVVRNDATTVTEVHEMQPDAVVLSPGPCAPQQAGICLDVVRQLHKTFPILGICLGHQVIAEALGGQVTRATEPVHGRASQVLHNNAGAFKGLASPMRVARYHSLVVGNLPTCLNVDAWLPDGTPMAISHVDYLLHGWQFHPESVLTTHGYDLLAAFLSQARLSPKTTTKVEYQPAKLENFARPDWFSKVIQYPH